MDQQKTTASDYGADSIRVLEGLEAVRKRPGMYIGDTSERGLHHLVFEVVDNSVDEALAGFCDTIQVTIHVEGSVTVEDNGRGIPTEMHSEGVSAAEVVLTKLHAGGKFEKGAYKVSGGLHGVGVSVVNALSEFLEVEIRRQQSVFFQRYRRGVPEAPLRETGTTDLRGTKVTFKPDPEIFETVDFSFEILSQRLRELAFLNKGLRISIADERESRSHEFYFEGGIVSFVEHLNRAKTPIHQEVIYLAGEKESVAMEKVLKDLVKDRSPQVTVESVQQVVSSQFAIKITDLKSPKRTRNLAFARQVAMYLSRKLANASMPAIGEKFGNRDHSTVFHAIQVIERRRDEDPGFHATLEGLERMIETQSKV